MAITVVLAIGIDPWLFEVQRSVRRSAGFFVTSVGTMDDSVGLFKRSDFDVVLLGNSLPKESLDDITDSIRALGSQVPIIRLSDLLHVADIHYSRLEHELGTLMNIIDTRLKQADEHIFIKRVA
jgi:DNA-binding response OmpR family regulator